MPSVHSKAFSLLGLRMLSHMRYNASKMIASSTGISPVSSRLVPAGFDTNLISSRGIHNAKEVVIIEPKRPRSGYIFFGNYIRPEIKKVYPLLKTTDITKEIGVRWMAMTPEEKAPFEEQANADRMRYANEKKLFDNSSQFVKRSEKPKSAYLLFMNHIRPIIKAESPDIKGQDAMKEIGHRWKALSPAEKVPFQEQADADKRRYAKEMKLDKVKKDKKTSGPKRPITAYVYFCNRMRPDLQANGLSSIDCLKELGACWKGMSSEEKAPYELLAAADRKRYYAEKGPDNKNANESKDLYAQGPNLAYIQFGNYVRGLLLKDKPEFSQSQIIAEIGTRWNNLSAQDKAFYQRKADADNNRYE